jgi:mRNA-degrading endonuclease RelE of RelBE toxin-antitoxin system
MAFSVIFAASVIEQLKAFSAGERAVIIEAIEQQLPHEPLTETRNRKPLRPNPIAPWELRIGSLRAFYEVTSDEPEIVRVPAVGRKRGHRLLIAGEEILL